MTDKRGKTLLEEVDRKLDAIDALKNGASAESVSEEFKFQIGIVREWITRYKILQSRKVTHNQALRIIKRYKEGASPSGLARGSGITPATLYSIFKKFGVRSEHNSREKRKDG